jgi:hypothetical protein
MNPTRCTFRTLAGDQLTCRICQNPLGDFRLKHSARLCRHIGAGDADPADFGGGWRVDTWTLVRTTSLKTHPRMTHTKNPPI